MQKSQKKKNQDAVPQPGFHNSIIILDKIDLNKRYNSHDQQYYFL